jgi:arsenate reductase
MHLALMVTIVFVCEHGAAKSVVAAAHFNRIAQEQHLPYRAVARGTDPQAEPSPSAVAGLHEEGLKAEPVHPTKLSKADVDGAERVVAFCDIPSEMVRDAKKVERWNAPATGDGYAVARNVIVELVKGLIASLRRSR